MTGVGRHDKHGVHRRTVRQALDNAKPPERKTPARAAPKLDPAKALIDAMLTGDLTAPRRQGRSEGCSALVTVCTWDNNTA